jgi:signal transduction histidine kinase
MARLKDAALWPRSLPAQMMAVLAGSFVVLLVILTALEIADQGDLAGWVEHDSTIRRLRRMRPALELLAADRRAEFLDAASFCHEGYSVTRAPHAPQGASPDVLGARDDLARILSISAQDVVVGPAILTRQDFAYGKCPPTAIPFPVEGLVIAVRLSSGEWLNAEIHPHEWHLHPELITWLVRSGAVFLVVGVAAVFFAHRLSRPLARLTDAAERFGSGLEVFAVEETGPTDLRRAIAAFNAMQKRVADEVRRRAHVLAAISHDLRSPLTALRIKAELVENAQARADLIASIDKMEKMTAAALEFLKGDSRSEPLGEVDLAALLIHECDAARDVGLTASYSGPSSYIHRCRGDALARAVRNLIENANKYAAGAEVQLRCEPDHAEIVVADHGPGVREEDLIRILEPFERLSTARESGRGGFGLGLAIVKAVCGGHDGSLELRANEPSGLVALMRLPRT